MDKFVISNSLSIKSQISLGGRYDIFLANISSYFDVSSEINYSNYTKSGFLRCYSYAEYKNYSIVEFGNVESLSSMLSENFLNVINRSGNLINLSNEELANYIIDNYGTHLIMGVKTGGRLDYYYTFATNNVDVVTSFKVNLSTKDSLNAAEIISALSKREISSELNISLERGETKQSSKFKFYGGSTSDINESNIADKLISWSSSINDSNARSIGLPKYGAICISDIIAFINPELADAINDAIIKRANNSFNELCSKFVNYDPIQRPDYDFNSIISSTFTGDVVCENTTIGNAKFNIMGVPVLYNNKVYIYGNALYSGNLNGNRFNDVDSIKLYNLSNRVLFGGTLSWYGSKNDINEAGVSGWDCSKGIDKKICEYIVENPTKDFAGNESVTISINGICVETNIEVDNRIPYVPIKTSSFTATLYTESTRQSEITFNVIGFSASYNGKEYLYGTAYYDGPINGSRFNDVGTFYLKNPSKTIVSGGTLHFRGSKNDNNESAVMVSYTNSLNYVNAVDICYMPEDPKKDFAGNEPNIITITNFCICIGELSNESNSFSLEKSSFDVSLYTESTLQNYIKFDLIGINTIYEGNKHIYGVASYIGNIAGSRFNDVERVWISLSSSFVSGGQLQYRSSYDDNNEAGFAIGLNCLGQSTCSFYLEDPRKDFAGNELTTIIINCICISIENE